MSKDENKKVQNEEIKFLNSEQLLVAVKDKIAKGQYSEAIKICHDNEESLDTTIRLHLSLACLLARKFSSANTQLLQCIAELDIGEEFEVGEDDEKDISKNMGKKHEAFKESLLNKYKEIINDDDNHTHTLYCNFKQEVKAVYGSGGMGLVKLLWILCYQVPRYKELKEQSQQELKEQIFKESIKECKIVINDLKKRRYCYFVEALSYFRTILSNFKGNNGAINEQIANEERDHKKIADDYSSEKNKEVSKFFKNKEYKLAQAHFCKYLDINGLGNLSQKNVTNLFALLSYDLSEIENYKNYCEAAKKSEGWKNYKGTEAKVFLGISYLAEKNHSEAQKCFEAALSLAKKNQEICYSAYYPLGFTLYKLAAEEKVTAKKYELCQQAESFLLQTKDHGEATKLINLIGDLRQSALTELVGALEQRVAGLKKCKGLAQQQVTNLEQQLKKLKQQVEKSASQNNSKEQREHLKQLENLGQYISKLINSEQHRKNLIREEDKKNKNKAAKWKKNQPKQKEAQQEKVFFDVKSKLDQKRENANVAQYQTTAPVTLRSIENKKGAEQKVEHKTSARQKDSKLPNEPNKPNKTSESERVLLLGSGNAANIIIFDKPIETSQSIPDVKIQAADQDKVKNKKESLPSELQGKNNGQEPANVKAFTIAIQARKQAEVKKVEIVPNKPEDKAQQNNFVKVTKTDEPKEEELKQGNNSENNSPKSGSEAQKVIDSSAKISSVPVEDIQNNNVSTHKNNDVRIKIAPVEGVNEGAKTKEEQGANSPKKDATKAEADRKKRTKKRQKKRKHDKKKHQIALEKQAAEKENLQLQKKYVCEDVIKFSKEIQRLCLSGKRKDALNSVRDKLKLSEAKYLVDAITLTTLFFCITKNPSGITLQELQELWQEVEKLDPKHKYLIDAGSSGTYSSALSAVEYSTQQQLPSRTTELNNNNDNDKGSTQRTLDLNNINVVLKNSASSSSSNAHSNNKKENSYLLDQVLYILDILEKDKNNKKVNGITRKMLIDLFVSIFHKLPKDLTVSKLQELYNKLKQKRDSNGKRLINKKTFNAYIKALYFQARSCEDIEREQKIYIYIKLFWRMPLNLIININKR